MILIVTHSQDFYVPELVAESLTKKNIPSLRVNTDEFPEKFCLTASIAPKGINLEFQSKERSFSLSDVKGAWLRKYWEPRIREDIDPQFKDGVFRESKEVLEIFLHSLTERAVIDPFHITQRAANKFFQLQTARAAGLSVPETLITNSGTQLQQYYTNSTSEIVAKMLTPLSTSMRGTDFFVYTTKLTDEHLKDSELLKDCPMAFQEYIEKAYELRVIYVDGLIFTGKIDASASQAGKTDWRRALPGEVFWEAYELPQQVAKKIGNFMNSMGLAFGAIDMIRSREGDYVFLEVNTNGEWGMLERDLHYQISDAIAAALIKRIQ